MRRTTAVVAAVVLAGGVANKAFAEGESGFRAPHALLDRGPQERSNMLTFYGFLPYYWGFGVGFGARFAIPIVKDGFIPQLNDSFWIEFGGDLSYEGLGYWYPVLVLGVPAEVDWAFHLTPKLAAYVKLGLGIRLMFATGYYGSYAYSLFWLYPRTSVGILFKFTDKIALRAETGYPLTLVGIAIDL